MGGHLLGWRTVCAVEFDAYARSVLLARQRDGMLPRFPIWDDVRTFDGHPWRGHVDIVSGGFPCQDISAAGTGAGLDGARSGLWVEMARIIREVQPRFAFVENSPMLTSRGLGTVLGDLAALGYDAEWGVLGAADVGAWHQRDRIWVVAHTERATGCRKTLHDADGHDCHEMWRAAQRQSGYPSESDSGSGGNAADFYWPVEPDVGRVAYGVAKRVDRLRCLGNGQVPRVAAEAWRRLLARIDF